MNFRLYLLLLAVLPSCFAACARKEKAVVDLRVDEKVIEVRRDEVTIGETAKDNVTERQSSQTAPQKISDNSEITVMYDGFGNKLEKRYFKGHPRLDSVLVRTAADGRREILAYGRNGEKRPIDGELGNRLMSASADEIANAAKIYGTRPVIRNQVITSQNEQTKPQSPVSTSVTVQQPPATMPQNETTVEEPVQKTPETNNSTENPPTKPQEEVKEEKKENRENK
ncbi:MAG TPA: hypothetical protein VF604_05090 [Pyrinomonadaceae bacterium]|jgi:hypothetical protein